MIISKGKGAVRAAIIRLLRHQASSEQNSQRMHACE